MDDTKTCRKCGVILRWNRTNPLCVKCSVCVSCAKPISHNKTERCWSCSLKIRVPPMQGKHHTEETKRKLSLVTKFNPSRYWLGKKMPGYVGKKISMAKKGNKLKLSDAQHLNRSIKRMGIQNPNWRGGVSRFKYGPGFTRNLRKSIRMRDSYRCQECFRHQGELSCPLNIHHIDYNKNNNSPDNLISLCKTCHSQTNFTREEWEIYLRNRLMERVGGNPYG